MSGIYEVRSPAKALLGWAALSGLFVLVGLGALLREGFGGAMGLAGLATALLFAWVAAKAARSALVGGPVLRCGEEALEISAPGFRGAVPWERIVAVETRSHRGQEFLVLRFREADALLAEQPPLRRLVAALNRNSEAGDLQIGANLLSRPVEEVRDRIVARLGGAA